MSPTPDPAVAPALVALASLLAAVGWGTARRRRAARRRLLGSDDHPGAPRRSDATAGSAGREVRDGRDAVDTLPEVLDLLGLAAAAGLPVAASVELVADRAPSPWNVALAAVVDAAVEGALLHDALAAVAHYAGPAADPLVGVLQSALSDGDRLEPGLAALAADARDLRRRRAQEAAARLPVRLLLPLVVCSLPAVAVLTIVPILAGALRGLRLAP